MIAYPFNPTEHRPMESLALSRWLQDRFRTSNIFVLHNVANGHFSVSEWRDGTKWGMLEDLLALGKDFRDFGKVHVKALDYLLDGPSEDPKKKIREARYEMRRMRQEWDEEDCDVFRWMARRTGDDEKYPWMKTLGIR